MKIFHADLCVTQVHYFFNTKERRFEPQYAFILRYLLQVIKHFPNEFLSRLSIDESMREFGCDRF